MKTTTETKVLVFANTAWYVANFRLNLIRSLINVNKIVSVASPYDSYVEAFCELGATYHPLSMSQRGMNPFREIWALLQLARIIHKVKPDIVLSYTLKCNLYAGLCNFLFKYEQVANISGLGEAFASHGRTHWLVSILYKLCMRRTRTIFCQNPSDLRMLTQSNLLPASRCRLIPGSGVDVDRYAPASTFCENRPRRFLMFGRLVPEKGYDQFLQVAKRFHGRFKSLAELYIMGIEDRSRKESRQLLERILTLHRKGLLTYIPARDNVAPVIQHVDVVVLPSQYNEGVPRSLLEAMACGKPILTSDWRGCRETVEDGVNGYLVKPGDWQQLAERMLDLARCPSEILKGMGQASRRLAEKKFDEEIVISAYLREVKRIEQNRYSGKRARCVVDISPSLLGGRGASRPKPNCRA